ncbi:hypothetical protein [Tessaracoccus sp. Y1736]
MELRFDAPERIKAVIQRIGAQISNVSKSGQVDFDLEGLHGTANVRTIAARREAANDKGLVVITFYIAVDTEEAEALAFVEAHPRLPIGELLVGWDPYEGTDIRLLVEFDPDSGEWDRDNSAWRAGYLAQLIASGWESREGGAADLANTLNRAGIAMPPLGQAVPALQDSVEKPPNRAHSFKTASVYTYAPWHWGSTYIEPFALYLFDAEQVARRLLETGPFFAMSRAGHGLFGRGLSLVTCAGPVAAFVQHSYGGMATSLSGLININATYSRLHWMFNSEQLEGSAAPLQWLLLYSELSMQAALVDLDRLRTGENFDALLERFGAPDVPYRLDESGVFSLLAERVGLEATTDW